MNSVTSNIQYCLVAVEEMRSATLRFHDSGVGDVCAALCAVLGLGEEETATLCFAAALHDIGKIVIPDAIINKPGPLDEAEWSVMRQHPQFGYNILCRSDEPTVLTAANVVLYHHECWDGSGYPKGLVGAAIPREARIVGICDVYHALREARPYRPALSHDTVMSMILDGDGTGRLHPGKFDPDVLAAFRAGSPRIRDAFDAAAL